jgi:hypothetical protein
MVMIVVVTMRMPMVAMRVAVARMLAVWMVVATVGVCDGGGFGVVVAHRWLAFRG